jgi:hypothetical protein
MAIVANCITAGTFFLMVITHDEKKYFSSLLFIGLSIIHNGPSNIE